MIALSRRVCLAVLLCAAPALAQDGVTAWVNQLLREKDDAELELVQKIAGSRTREGALGLVLKQAKITGAQRREPSVHVAA